MSQERGGAVCCSGHPVCVWPRCVAHLLAAPQELCGAISSSVRKKLWQARRGAGLTVSPPGAADAGLLYDDSDLSAGAQADSDR